ncbi:MAG TPA: ChbG/HpnK family deacetylase [Terriglobales bacterium]|nr:ChbG/HpnK family deacetylase [Terriglobales bacterium]
MRRLIINADDFGLTAGVNRGIVEAHQHGIVTSATLMAGGRAFAEAVQLAQRAPQLNVGCHIVLVDGEPLLPSDQVPTLLAGGNQQRHFRPGMGEFAAAALRGRIDAGQVEAEATAQMRKLQAAGLTLSHFDTHKHAHMFPAILRPLLRSARACGVRALRNPFAPVKPLAFAHQLRRPRLWKCYSEVKALRRLLDNFRQAAQEEQMLTTDGTFGIVSTGAIDQRLFEAIVGSIPEGTWEFVCHPGYNDADLDTVRTRLRSSREQELRVLTSEAAREALRRHGVELISWEQLLASSS